MQDADNLAWKLDLVLRGLAPQALPETHGPEREYAADENLLNSTRATDFITPKSPVSRLFRDAALGLARAHPFARRIVNSGRLSVPATLHVSPLNTPDRDAFAGAMVPGAPAADAPIGDGGWLLRRLAGNGFTALVFGAEAKAALSGIPRLVPVPLGASIGQARTTAILKTPQLELIRLVLRQGAAMREHRVAGDMTLLCIEGSVELSLPTGVVSLQAQDLIHLTGGVPHGLVATADASLLLTIRL